MFILYQPNAQLDTRSACKFFLGDRRALQAAPIRVDPIE